MTKKYKQIYFIPLSYSNSFTASPVQLITTYQQRTIWYRDVCMYHLLKINKYIRIPLPTLYWSQYCKFSVHLAHKVIFSTFNTFCFSTLFTIGLKIYCISIFQCIDIWYVVDILYVNMLISFPINFFYLSQIFCLIITSAQISKELLSISSGKHF